MSKKALLLIWGLIISSLILAGCGNNQSIEVQAEQENIFAVEVAYPKLGDLSQSITLSGQLSAIDTVTIIPEVQGLLEVRALHVTLGDYVKKGDTLFILDRENITDQIEGARLAYESSKANYIQQKERIHQQVDNTRLAYEGAKKSYEHAQANFERIEKLYEAGAVSYQDYQQAKLAASDIQLQQAKLHYKNSKAHEAQLASLESQLNQARTAYHTSSKTLENTMVTAPISGVISSLNIEVGGMASAQPALTITDISSLEVIVNATEGMINRVLKANTVELIIPAVSDEKTVGEIKVVNPVPDAKTQLYTVKITIDNPDGMIKPGMFAQVYMNTNERQNTTILPSEAVLQEEESFYVFVVEEERTMRKDISIGVDNGELVEIIDGLTLEDRVIVKGQDFLRDGYKVKIVRGEK